MTTSGDIITFNSSSWTSPNQTNWDLTNSATALNIESGLFNLDTTSSRVGIGTTAPSYKLDVNGDVRVASGSDYYLGTIGFNDNATSASGASLIGLNDDSYNNVTGNTTVQTAIGQIDSAIGDRFYSENNFVADSEALTLSIDALDMMLQNVVVGSTGLWLDQGSYIYASNATNVTITDTGRIGIGTTGPSVSLEVVGEVRGTRYAFQDDSDTYIDTVVEILWPLQQAIS